MSSSSTSVTTDNSTPDIWGATNEVLGYLSQDREREIVSRRFGLFERRETLEQIGDMLGITRERVRQLEKAIVTNLRQNASQAIPELKAVEKYFVKHLHEMGRAAKLRDFTESLEVSEGDQRKNMSHVAFLSTLMDSIGLIDESDRYHQGVVLRDHHDEKQVKSLVDTVHATIKEKGEPSTTQEIHAGIDDLEHPDHVGAVASLSKDLSHLNGMWGLAKWPTVNPRNIRDKIYVTLAENGKPMHFGEIGDAIQKSGLKRSDVTVQAIHNELIKDQRFVLIGRGIYALKEWGYEKGTVADVITRVLKDNNEKAMHRDDITKEVLKKRNVKPTTVMLNLQSKPQFKRVAKATYELDEEPAASKQ